MFDKPAPGRSNGETYVLARSFVPPSRLCTCTINAMANSGVARLTIGIETKAAMIRPPIYTVVALRLRNALVDCTL